MNVDLIVEAILHGIYTSNLEYEKWSRGDCWLIDSGAEHLMVDGITRSLYERLHKEIKYTNLRLEWNENNENFNLGIGSRVDIAMLDEERITKYVVEAKLRWNNENCRNDLNRIVNLVRGGVPCGFLAVLITRNNGEITERLNDIQELLEDFEHQNNGIDIKHFTSALWRYPMTWRYGHDYPNWERWQNWKGCGLCIKIQKTKLTKESNI